MNRIENLFQHKKQDVLTIYFTAGYPTLNDTVTIIQELDKTGADLIEIGIPYSDPLADGPTIQASGEVALKNGITIDLIFDQLKGIRNSTEVPMLFMGYYNQILQYGLEKLCQKCNEVGVDGLIFPDVPTEEYEKVLQPLVKKYNLTFTFLITPSTSDERIKLLDNLSSGFLYAVANHSVTGSAIDHTDNPYGDRLERLSLKNPVMVGFGIANQDDFQKASKVGNGCIIGSAFIKALQKDATLLENINQFMNQFKQVKVQ